MVLKHKSNDYSYILCYLNNSYDNNLKEIFFPYLNFTFKRRGSSLNELYLYCLTLFFLFAYILLHVFYNRVIEKFKILSICQIFLKMVKIKKPTKPIQMKSVKKVSSGIEKKSKKKTLKNSDIMSNKALVKKPKAPKEANVQKPIKLKAKKVGGAKGKTQEIKQKHADVDKPSKVGVKRTRKNEPRKISEKKPKEDIVSEDPEVSNLKATSFDETQFRKIVTSDNIEKVCHALKKIVEEQVTQKKTSIFSDYRYFLNVSSYMIPNCPKRMVKL